ncbi:hypothetical protein TrLO_g1659 [Triparma laevis f. longispina]|uniref:PPM-type phosphatase domain-containing protein n=1 Tax=Triparma laevis f. longispina TaxID=1714387 RepID=A0A9W7ADT0_9STRA|nr:hypothetical protein TrLO_g1659 [Triparma laevis f. longispina]
MSSDHSPLTRPDEVERIKNLGGNIHTGLYGFSGILTKFLSTIQDVTISLRVYHSNGIGGLNMTRALGDVYLKPLVIPDAEEREVERGEGYVVMGSDGLWDVVGVGEVWECLEEAERTFENEEDIVKNVSIGLTRGAMQKGSMDNITVLCIKISK